MIFTSNDFLTPSSFLVFEHCEPNFGPKMFIKHPLDHCSYNHLFRHLLLRCQWKLFLKKGHEITEEIEPDRHIIVNIQ